MVFKLKRVMQPKTKGKNDEKGDAVVPSASSFGPAGQSTGGKGGTNNNGVGARGGVAGAGALQKAFGPYSAWIAGRIFLFRWLVVDDARGRGCHRAEYSECRSGKKGGDLGWFPRGKMAGPFQEVAFNTPRGVLSAPFKSTHGYHIILGEERKN